MKKLTLATVAVIMLPGLAFAMGCGYGEHKAETAQMSCAEGMAVNADTNTCEPVTLG